MAIPRVGLSIVRAELNLKQYINTRVGSSILTSDTSDTDAEGGSSTGHSRPARQVSPRDAGIINPQIYIHPQLESWSKFIADPGG